MGKFATNASGALLLLNLIQVTESISGSVVPLAMFQVDVSIDLLQTVQIPLDYIETVLPTLREIHGTRDGFKTLSRNPVEIIYLSFFSSQDASYAKECAREKQV